MTSRAAVESVDRGRFEALMLPHMDAAYTLARAGFSVGCSRAIETGQRLRLKYFLPSPGAAELNRA